MLLFIWAYTTIIFAIALSFSSSKPDADWIRGRYHSHSFYQFLGKYQRKTLANYWNEYY